MNFVEFIGQNAIFIIIMYGVVGLYRNLTEMSVFLVALAFNDILNHILKCIFQSPRPRKVESDKNTCNYYGMPSGHAQHVGFGITYLSLIQVPYAQVLWIIGLMTTYERYISRSHTFEQILAGLGVGVVFGYFVYHIKSYAVGDNTHFMCYK
jgi:membrane-associated phospholipid phosphatase